MLNFWTFLLLTTLGANLNTLMAMDLEIISENPSLSKNEESPSPKNLHIAPEDSLAIKTFIEESVLSQTITKEKFDENYNEQVVKFKYTPQDVLDSYNLTKQNYYTPSRAPKGMFFLFSYLYPEDRGLKSLIDLVWSKKNEASYYSSIPPIKYSMDGVHGSKSLKDFLTNLVYSDTISEEEFNLEFKNIKYTPDQIQYAYETKYGIIEGKYEFGRPNSSKKFVKFEIYKGECHGKKYYNFEEQGYNQARKGEILLYSCLYPNDQSLKDILNMNTKNN